MKPTLFLLSNYTIKSLLESSSTPIGKNVTINGWIRSVRRFKKVAFADITDGTCSNSLAVVMSPDQSKPLTTGACVEVSGKISDSPGSQKFELQLNEEDIAVKILGPADSSYPLQKKYHTPEYLRTIPSFRWKTSTNSSVLRYRSFAISSISKYFESEDFIQVNSPIITSSDCEGAGEVFSVNSSDKKDKLHFFGDKPAYLSVSSQLHLEIYSAALSRVWNITPAFRAEKSDTNRHLSEFWMIEAELAFTKGLEDIMHTAEKMIRSAVPNEITSKDLLESSKQNKPRKELMTERWKMLSGDPWARITYAEAIELLQNELSNSTNKPKYTPIKWGDSLSSDHEKYLSANIIKGPVFVTDYPQFQKPFYMKKNKDSDITKPTVACFDLLVPDMGELIGGSLREDNYEALISSMKEHNMNPSDLEWYSDLRKYGSFPHGGYGMGFERLVCFICGVENIREAIGFPRWAGSCIC